MKLNVWVVGLASIVLISCNNRHLETVVLTPMQNWKTGKWGYFDENGKQRIPYRYDMALDFSDDLAIVGKDGKVGFINKTGKIVVKIKYDAVWPFSESITSARINDKCGFIDKSGKELTPFKYDDTRQFSEGIAQVKINNKWGFVDNTGNEVATVKYDEINNSFSEGYTWIRIDDKYGFIDKTGNEIIPVKYDEVGMFSEGLVTVKIDSSWGFIDKTGNEIIPVKYKEVGFFSEGLAPVKLHGEWKRWGYIDKIGNEVIPMIYLNAESFSDGLAMLRLSVFYAFNLSPFEYVYIDKTGMIYDNREIHDLLVSLLGNQLKEIYDYRLSLKKTSGSSVTFTINRPYLVINTDSYDVGSGNETPELFKGILKYSENEFNVQAAGDVKTVIIKYDFFDSSNYYFPGGTLVCTYGTYLIYYDREKKEIIGHDVIPSINLPSRITELHYRYNSVDDIEKKIASHIALPNN